MKIYSLFCMLLFTCFADADDSWSQKTLEKMSLREKIGQLFMVAAYVDTDYASREIGNPNIIDEIGRYITLYHVGGLAYVGPSECIKQVKLTNHYQELSKYPILIAQDLEWGLAMRIKDGMAFPKNITLGALQDNTLIYKMGKEIGRQAKLIGVHMNLSPDLDVNIEPENIVINVRSFGSNPHEVAEKGIAMIQGLQDAGIIASAKHFPGLGDIAIDPHLGLPYSKHSKERLQAVELFPFAQAIQAGVLSIQTDHLLVPALEPDTKLPSSLSPKIITDLMKNEMGFKGLALSGALRMKALTEHLPDDEIILKAFLAGNDMLLMPKDFPNAYKVIQTAVSEGKIHEEEINARVLKILQMKEKMHLDIQKTTPIPVMEQLHTPTAKALKKEIYQKVVAVARNNSNLLPVTMRLKGTAAYVQLGEASSSNYFEALQKQFAIDSFILPLDFDEKKTDDLLNRLKNYPLIFLAIFPLDPRRIEQIRLLNENKLKEELKNFRVHGISESILPLLKALKRYDGKMITAYFGNPFGKHFFDEFTTFIMGYEPDADAQEAAARLVQ